MSVRRQYSSRGLNRRRCDLTGLFCFVFFVFLRLLLPVRLFSAAPAPKQQWRFSLEGPDRMQGAGFTWCYLTEARWKPTREWKRWDREVWQVTFFYLSECSTVLCSRRKALTSSVGGVMSVNSSQITSFAEASLRDCTARNTPWGPQVILIPCEEGFCDQ